MKETFIVNGRKRCPRCETDKTVEEFSPDKSKKSGLSSYCKACRVPLCVAGHRKNPEVCRRAQAKFRRLRPERATEIQEKHYATGKREATLAAWRAANIISVRLYVRNRRARTRGSDGRVTKEDIERIFRLQKGKCAICRKKLPVSYHIDHIKALSRGGKHEPRNIQLTCGPCNLTKNAQDPIDFMRKLGRLL